MSSSPEISRQVPSSAQEIPVSSQKKINYKHAAKITAVVISILGFAALGSFVFHQYVGFQAAGSWINQTFSNMTVWQGIVFITLPTIAVGGLGIGIYALRVCLKSKKDAPAQTEGSTASSPDQAPGSQPNSPTIDPIEPPTTNSSAPASQHSSRTVSPTRSPGSDAGSMIIYSSPEGTQSPTSQPGSITSSPVQSPTLATEDVVEELNYIYPQPLPASRASSTLFVDPRIIDARAAIFRAFSTLPSSLWPQRIVVGVPTRRTRSNPVSAPSITTPRRLTIEELPEEKEPSPMTTTYTGREIHGEDDPLSKAAANLVDLFQAPETSDRSSTRLFDREISDARPPVNPADLLGTPNAPMSLLADLLGIPKAPMSLSDILGSAPSEDHEFARRLEQ